MNTLPKKLPLNTTLLYSAFFGLLVFITYSKLFSAGFISWDDGDVLLNNKDVHRFDIKAFFTSYYVGNYAPITMIGFAIDWFLFKGNAMLHHGISVLLHIVNAVLVFQLCRYLLNNNLKALICAIVFCIHPLQVETVAWVSAKNNIMYSFFFLLGLIFYTRYLIENQKKHYVFALLLFLVSVLSKPSAICFPLCLFLLDYLVLEKNKITFVNKVPFFILALILGIATIYTRTEDKFINESHAYAIHERIGYAGYALVQYLYKFVAPIDLSVIYPYPQHKLLALSIGYACLIILGIILYKLFKLSKKQLLFGILFFISNLLLVLQFIPFGEVLTADRYMYLPIIGLCVSILSLFKVDEQKLKIVLIGLFVIFGSFTFFRVNVWRDSAALYSDILKKYPHSFVALNSLGAQYMLNKNYDLAMRYLNAAIDENKMYYKGYYNRGLLYAQTKRYNDALRDFDKAIALKKYYKAYVARANVFYELKEYDKAIKDAQQVLIEDANNSKANFVMATCYDETNQLQQALSYYNKALAITSDNPLYFLRRGILFGKMQQYSSCLSDFDKAILIDPQYPETYYWRGVVKVNLKQNPCEDLKRAIELGFSPAQQAFQSYCH